MSASGEDQGMLLPIVLLLATAASTRQVDAAGTAKQSLSSEHSQVADELTRADGFVNNPQLEEFDKGIMLPHGSQKGCLSITAYVFSDGENPQLKYVTHCPNLDVPLQNKRAHGKGSNPDGQPNLLRTK